MKCRECMDQLEQFADRELSDAEVVKVQAHLDTCSPCMERYRFEASLKRVVRVCCEQDKAPEELRARLREILY